MSLIILQIMRLNCSQPFLFNSSRFILFGRHGLLLTFCSEIQCTGFADLSMFLCFENDIPDALYHFLQCVYVCVVIVDLVYIQCMIVCINYSIKWNSLPSALFFWVRVNWTNNNLNTLSVYNS